MTYTLEIWSKAAKRYLTTWTGTDLERGLIMARKPYNNYPWMGKARIVAITRQVIPIPRKRKNALHRP